MKQKLYNLLRWSERYTKTDMVYLSKGGFWLTAGHGVQMLSGLVLAVAFANLLPKEAYGTYQFVMSGAVIVGAFTLTGMATAVTRAVGRGSEGALRYGFRMQLVWSTGIVLAGGAVALYYFLQGNTTLGAAFLIVGALAPFTEGFPLYRSYLIGKQLFRESAILGFWRKPLPIIALLSTLFVTHNPVVLVFVYFASNALSSGLLYYLTIRRYKPPYSPNSELSNYSKHLSVMGLIRRLATHIDKILIFHFLGAAPVAVYMLATLPTTHLRNLFGLVGPMTLSKFAQRDYATLQKTLFRKVLIFFVIAACVVVMYIFAAPYLYALLFPAYPEAVLLSQVAILALLAKPRMLYGKVFIAHGMKRVQYILQFSTAGVKIALLVTLLPLYGLWGAVGTLLATYVFSSVVATFFFYKK